MKNKNRKNVWVMGIDPKESIYQVNGVTYIVTAKFDARGKEEQSLRSRMERLIQGNSVSLTRDEEDDIITVEYVSAAHPNSDRKEKYAEESSSQTT